MLFIAVGKAVPGDARPVIARRAEWSYPPGVKVVAEYWPMHADMAVISVIEAESAAPILGIIAEWSDAFSWTVAPAVTADEGIAMFKSMPR